MKECIVCGRPNSEKHHVVFRSQQKGLEHCKKNIICLCSQHHRGNCGPHKNREIDLEYKLKFQNKLFKLFNKKEYKQEEISKLLDISDIAAYRICKAIDKHVDKYYKEDVIRACMGGKLYGYGKYIKRDIHGGKEVTKKW